MVDPPATPHRERRLHIVRDGEPGPDPAPPAPGPPGSAGGGSVRAPAAPWGVAARWSEEVEPAHGRWVTVRPTAPAGRRRRVAWVWAGVTVGTAVAGILDRLVGGLDGRPALFLLIVLALPFWDGLPARVAVRLAELAVVAAAVAAAWLAVAAIRPEGWWRAEIAYGLACGIAGTAHALLSRRRTVER